MNNTLIDKYKEDLKNILEVRCQVKNCLDIKCKSLVNKLNKKNLTFIKKIKKINDDYNSTEIANNLNRDINDLTNKFNQNKYILEYNKYMYPPKPIPKNVTVKYDKEFKKYMKNMSMLVKNHEKNPKFIKKLNDINKLKKDFINSKEVNNLKKCTIQKCKDLHLKTIELTKNFSKKLCENEKNKHFCKIYKSLVKKINIKNNNFIKMYKIKINIF